MSAPGNAVTARPAPDAGADGGEAMLVLRLSGEVSTKARPTRRQFVNRLVRNLKDALDSAGSPAGIERAYDRLFLREAAASDVGLVQRVFGVQSVSPARRLPVTDLDGLLGRARARFHEAVRGRRFAVRCRHVGNQGATPFRSRDVERGLGELLRPGSAGVDLSRPEVTAHVEVYRGQAYLFSETLAGPAGLPLGAEGRAVALVSGGFDSAVAAWQLMKRGVRLDYVFCNLGGRSHELGALRVAKVLADRWSYGDRPRLHALDFGPVVRELQAKAEPRYWQVLLKRYMLRAADHVARSIRSDAIVTGEAIGQVSSQTLPNLAAISEATRLPVLRPLLGFNKDEIIRRAEQIGTAALSAVVGEYCAIAPRRPATSSRLRILHGQEQRLDPGLLAPVLEGHEVLDLRCLDPESRALPELATERVPEGAVLIDLRSRRDYAAWHPPEALHLDFRRALEAFPCFDRSQRYLLYCEFGLKSAHLAEEMRRQGFECLHFRGGSAALRRRVEEG